MMHRIYLLLIIAVMAMAPTKAGAQANYHNSDSTSYIVDAILESDAMVVIEQPSVLAERLMPFAVIKSTNSKKDKRVDPHIRYRVQVFSDNNSQTAKPNAEYRKRLIEQRMPGVVGYVTYDAPYWRVRMGNYQTEAEAQTAMKQIKGMFPTFSSDVRVVKVRVGN